MYMDVDDRVFVPPSDVYMVRSTFLLLVGSSGRELCGPPVPGSLVDGRAVHVHACIVRASPAIPRAFAPVFEGHVHFIVLDASGSCAALNEDLVTGFPLSEVRFVPSRQCFGRALHSELVTSVVPGSPRVYPVTRGLFNLRFVSGSTNAPHGISVGDVDDGGYPVALPKRAAFPLRSPSSVLLQLLSDVRTIRLAGLTMPRSTKHRGESSRASRRSEGDVQRTEDPMPHFTLSPLREDDPERLDKGVKVCALGPLEETSPSEGVVDMRRVDRTERGYRYRRGGDYPGHFPLDDHLFPFIQSFVPVNWEGPDGLLLSERAQLERAILVGRDSMMGTCSFHYPSFPVDYTAQAHFLEAGQLGLFSAEPVNRVRELMLAQGLWEVHGLPKTGPTFTGHIPLPSGPEFVSEGYDRSCFLDRIMSKEAAGWYDRWSVISSHRFRFGATEWLMGILYHYRQLLDQVGLLHTVVAALYSYPCHSGLLQALAERFNRRFNTFCVADGETCLDLWALHRISGLPISGQFYEEVCLNDLLRDQSTGAGSYVLSHSFRGAEIVAEIMEMGPSVAVFSSAATQAGVEGAPHGAVTAPLLSVAGESLTAAGGDAPLPPFAAASPVRLAPFPSHGVLWPSEPQSIQMVDKGGVLETLMGLVRSAMEESSPPCLERVRGFLYRNTRAYHLMGFPRDPWMAVVDAVWDEVQQRCQEATRLKI
ncbi:hypothetical protein Taro_054236 [Colocasia esculenta]|uniref:Uncharacterized protein n=1 Tax=Colocasia esculenta TaxID=4460 RepID=A0A843XPZ6_COLES|nr:hypothetical protein [Colocasia esculenta]